MKTLYTAEAVVEGGREGHGRTSDGRLEVDLSIPEGLGGQGGTGTNPEQLFAGGLCAWFPAALLAERRQWTQARRRRLADRVTSGVGATGMAGWA